MEKKYQQFRMQNENERIYSSHTIFHFDLFRSFARAVFSRFFLYFFPVARHRNEIVYVFGALARYPSADDSRIESAVDTRTHFIQV